MSTPEPDRPADATTAWEVTLSGSCYFEVTLEVAAIDREQALHLARKHAYFGMWSFSGPAKVSYEAALRISPEAAHAAAARRALRGTRAIITDPLAWALNEKPGPTPDTPSAAHIAAARKHLGLGESDFIIVEIDDGKLIARRIHENFYLIPYPPEDGRDVEGGE